MTANQIAYWKLVEEQRSNRAKESETFRSNVEKEVENRRHNIATESHDSASLIEAQRHNLASESNDAIRNAETRRHNTQTESTDRKKAAADTTRANAAYNDAFVRQKTYEAEYPWSDKQGVFSRNAQFMKALSDTANTVSKLFN